MTAFTLGRMRHPGLLALWHQLHPDSRQRDQAVIARLTTGHLVRAILGGTR